MARKTLTYKGALEIVILQSGLACHRCGVSFAVDDVKAKPSAPNAIQREHIWEIALGGPDTPDNCRFSHKRCHAIETNGNGATTAGSSKHRIAKTKRKEDARAALVLGETNAEHLAQPKRPKQQIQNRSFGKGSMKRTVSGQAVPRERAN